MATTRATGREQNPVDDEFLDLLYRGGELLAAGKVIEAKDFLERAHKLQPKHEKGQNLLGLTYFKLGLFDRAAELYEMLVRDNPVDPTLRVNLGLVYLKTNALQRAVREFEVAVDLAPDHKKAHNYLGLALAQQGEYGRAREHFLLAGSDAMAEKMSRAIAGEGFSRPAPVQPAKARGFAELEGSEVVREQGGVPVAETPSPVSAEMVIDVVEDVPAQSAAPVPPPPPPESMSEAPPTPVPPPPPQQGASHEEDWGAQFGLDEGPPPAEAQGMAEAPAPAAPPEAPTATQSEASSLSAELDFSGVGGPAEASSQAAEEVPVASVQETAVAPPEQEQAGAAAVGASELPVLPIEELTEDGVPVLTAEPENAGEMAAIAQHEQPPSGVTQVFAAAVGSTAEAPAASVEQPPVMAAPVVGYEAPAPAEPQAPAEEAWTIGSPAAIPTGLSPIPSAPAAVSVPVRAVTWREGGVPILGELAPAVALGGASSESPFVVGVGGLCARVDGELLTRMEGLVAFTGQLTFKPEMKRFRGRTTDKPFGEGSMRVVRAVGRGTLFIEPGEQITFQAVDLGDESAYFRDECVFAFEEPVMFENGRVPSDVAPDLDLVHLRGNGKVLLSLAGPLRSVPVTMDAAATVPLTHLVGWQGNLTPRVVSLLQGAAGESLKTAVELSGEGFALICLPVR
jgi:uncharacterized protein (AIM24 family)